MKINVFYRQMPPFFRFIKIQILIPYGNPERLHSKKKPCDFSLDTIIKSSSTAPTVRRSILLSQTQELILVHQVRSLASSVLPGGCQLAQLCHRQMASRVLALARMNTSRNLMPATPNLSFSQINPSQRESIMLIPDPRLLPDSEV